MAPYPQNAPQDDAAMRHGIRRRQWEELIFRLPAVLGGLVVTGTAFILVAWGSIHPQTLGLWIACFAACTLYLLWFFLRHRSLNTWVIGWQALMPRFLMVILLQAIVWGVGLALILPDNPRLQLMSLVLLISLLSGSPLALSSHFPTLVVFATALILPMGVHFALSEDPKLQILGLASVPCLLIYAHGGWLLSSHLLGSYIALERNERLVNALSLEQSRLHDALGQAEQANNAKSRFLAGASHDLRQPLQAIGLLVSSLGREQALDKRRALFDNLTQSVGRLDRLFNRLLDISRLDAGAVQARSAWVTTSDLLQAQKTQFEAIAEKRGLKLRFRDVAHKMVNSDSDLLEQVLSNLISNALRYTRQGGVLVAARMRDGQLVFQVWDSGIGIEAEQLGTIFEEFVQLDNPIHRQTRGLGLGLAISRRISAVLNAELGVSSRPGSGSRFELALSAQAALQPDQRRQARPATAPDFAPASSSLAGAYVLVVDDEPDILLGLLHGLSQSGCYVKTAQTLQQTHAWLESTERLPDALVVDYRLTRGETAWDIIGATRQACGGQLAVVIITGELNPERDARAAQAGCVVLTKPVSLTVLEAELASALQRLNRQLEPGARE